jgi:hypothetical protein
MNLLCRDQQHFNVKLPWDQRTTREASGCFDVKHKFGTKYILNKYALNFYFGLTKLSYIFFIPLPLFQKLKKKDTLQSHSKAFTT